MYYFEKLPNAETTLHLIQDIKKKKKNPQNSKVTFNNQKLKQKKPQKCNFRETQSKQQIKSPGV